MSLVNQGDPLWCQLSSLIQCQINTSYAGRVFLTELAAQLQLNYYSADGQSDRRPYYKGDFSFGGQDFYFVYWRLGSSDRQRGDTFQR